MGGSSLTPHQRPHRVNQIDGFCFHAGTVLRAAAEGGLVLRCVAPADCVVIVSFAVLLGGLESVRFRGLGILEWVGE